MGIPKLWGKDKSGNRGFVFSHVKTIYYNWASKILLKTKLDEMDALIDAKIAKAMMSNQQINDANKVPTSALAYAMQQAITENANGINAINGNLGDIKYTYLRTNDETLARNPLGVLKSRWNDLEFNKIYLAKIVCGSDYVALVQKYSSHLHGSATIFSYEKANPIYAKLNNGTWTEETLITNTDLQNPKFWFPKTVLPWGNYSNGTYTLEEPFVSKPIRIVCGENGRLSSFWTETQIRDVRAIVIPDGIINIKFDSSTQITISGTTENWNVRGIYCF